MGPRLYIFSGWVGPVFVGMWLAVRSPRQTVLVLGQDGQGWLQKGPAWGPGTI